MALLAISAALAACSDDDAGLRRLNTDQGAALLRDIRSNPSRTQRLTPAERVYLSEHLNGR